MRRIVQVTLSFGALGRRVFRSNIGKRPHLQLRPTNMERPPRKLRRQHSKKIQKQLHRPNQKHHRILLSRKL